MISIKMCNERVAVGKTAKIEILNDKNERIALIQATTSPQQGIDGGSYPAVLLCLLSLDEKEVITEMTYSIEE